MICYNDVPIQHTGVDKEGPQKPTSAGITACDRSYSGVLYGRSAVRWAWDRFRRAPATTPSPSEPSPSLHWRPLGRYSSGATAARAGALEPPVNELIDTSSVLRGREALGGILFAGRGYSLPATCSGVRR
jgi:hypothetical protein